MRQEKKKKNEFNQILKPEHSKFYFTMAYMFCSPNQIRGLPASIDSKEELCDVLSRFISHVTIRHAAVNYAITDYQRYVPNQPTKLYNDTRVENGEFSVFRLPNRLTTAVSKAFYGIS